MSILERAAHEPGARRARVGLVLLPLLLGGLVLAVREVGRVERALAAEGERVQRVVVYELPLDGSVHARIGPDTDVVRLVFHALRRHVPLDAQRHVAHIRLRARGLRGELTEDVALELPGTTGRITPEDAELTVGDPLSINVDLHGVGAGELLVELVGIEGADAVALRMYRRDVLVGDALANRLDGADEAERRHVALHVGELDFADAEPDAQRALLGERWRKLSATRGTGAPLRTFAVALTRTPEPAAPVAAQAEPPPDTVVELLGAERASWLVHGPCSVRLTAVDDPLAELRARVRDAAGDVRSVAGKGELIITLEDGRLASIEAVRAGPGRLALRAQGDGALEPAAHAIAWRTTPTRPLVVDAGTSDLVLRVSARRPVARASVGDFAIALDASIESAESAESAGKNGALRASTTLSATRPRAAFDRYEGPSPVEAPTESALFYVLVPAGARARLAPKEGELDLSLAELDPSAPPRAVPTFPIERGWKPTVESGGASAAGYAPRRPSNAEAFTPDARIVVHLPRRLVELPIPPTAAPTWRVRRPESATTLTIAGRVFEPETAVYELEVTGGEPMVLPVRLYATSSITVLASVDGAAPRRLDTGFADSVTTTRSFAVDGEVRSVVVLGDDLAPGPHTLRFTTAPGEHAWIHLPWTAKPRLPGSPPRAPRWIEGDLDD